MKPSAKSSNFLKFPGSGTPYVLLILAFAFSTAFLSAAFAEEPTSQATHYHVSFDSAANHYVHVEVTLPRAEGMQEFFMPVWTPGSYLVREYSRHVDSLAATGKDANALPVKKVSKNRWQVDCESGEPIKLSYRVYCNELTVRTNFVDSQFALLSGAALFMTTDERAGATHTITLSLPQSWSQSVTSLERSVSMGPNTFTAENFDEVVDSPIVAGNPTVHPFVVGETEHYLVNIGDNSLWAGERAAVDVAKIVMEHQKMWGLVPYKRYYFLNVIAESGGGLEHDNSTVMLTSRWSFRDPKRYKSWLGLVSHEFFHTWNVRRLRPKALSDYGYEDENYFEELWVAEGVTSYYDDLALARAGVTSSKEYLAGLSKQIDTLQSTEGRLRQSLAESSFDAWIKFYRSNENSRNTTISYYNKGAVVAFLLDIEIRSRTTNEFCLDDCMRALYEKHADNGGYTTKDIIVQLETMTNSPWEEWFQTAIYSTHELDYEVALDWLGLQFTHSKKLKSKTPKDSESSRDGPIWTGMSTKADGGKLLVSSVTESGPAFRAGINVDDEIIAVNRYRAGDSLSSRLNQFRQDEKVDLLISRRGGLIDISLELEQKPFYDWRLIPVAMPSEEQTQNLALWLHQENESAKSSEDTTDDAPPVPE